MCHSESGYASLCPRSISSTACRNLGQRTRPNAGGRLTACERAHPGRNCPVRRPIVRTDRLVQMAQRLSRPAPSRFEERRSCAAHTPPHGLTILYGLRHADERTWVDGKIYNPDDGTDYNARMSIQDDGSLRVRAYLLLPLFGRTLIWKRVR